MPFVPLSNGRFKRYNRLSQKRYRKKEGLYLIEGIKLVKEAIRSGAQVEAIIVAEDTELEFNFQKALPQKLTFTANSAQFADLHTQEQPEGLVAVLPLPDAPVLDDVSGPAFVLEGVRDPGNLGTLLRTADWFGFPAVYMTTDCVDIYNPKVLRAAMGAHFHLQVFMLDDLKAFVDTHADRLLATKLRGVPLSTETVAKRDLILLGSESHGLSQAALGHPDVAYVEIPGRGSAESLNVSVAGAIMAHVVYSAQI